MISNIDKNIENLCCYSDDQISRIRDLNNDFLIIYGVFRL